MTHPPAAEVRELVLRRVLRHHDVELKSTASHTDVRVPDDQWVRVTATLQAFGYTPVTRPRSDTGGKTLRINAAQFA